MANRLPQTEEMMGECGCKHCLSECLSLSLSLCVCEPKKMNERRRFCMFLCA